MLPLQEGGHRNQERAPLDVLRGVFGFDHFRGEQLAVIQHLVAGGDAIVLMPTGGGKSLCYQIPALICPGLGVVVSPLIALMKDQVDALRQIGVRAAALNSRLSPAEAAGIERAVRKDALDLLYVSPERLITARCLDLLSSQRLALFAVDEAHCISQWGHDFRPEYQQLSILKRRFPQVPIVALTATADGPTRRDIVGQLGLAEARIFAAGYDRPNLFYRIVSKRKPLEQLWRYLSLDHPDDAGIVYCLTRRAAEETAAWLAAKGRRAYAYHAGLEAAVRERNQEHFLNDHAVVIAATIAFGMGIDKPNVRFVAHLDVPKNLEAYYQETGRAGRDGLPADAWMCYGLADVMNLVRLLDAGEKSPQQRRIERQKLDALIGYCETISCRRQVLLGYFGEVDRPPCGNCDNCCKPPASWDGTIAAQKALSAVYRTGQRFGAHHLVDILLGNETERVLRLRHNQLKTFGVGRELDRNAWLSVFRQLIARGLVVPDIGGHGGLSLAAAATEILRGKKTLQFRLDPPSERRRDQPAERSAVRASELEPAAKALWEALRAWRLEEARRQEVPPFVIFHDSTLIEIARCHPTSLPALSRISGLGRIKLERYGNAVIEIVAGQDLRGDLSDPGTRGGEPVSPL
ncbi:MAG: DNA helicase RecQ [Alphaproteobacteria bacterium]|nr:DNA helicase RecQ [Alphaproteobacteria bacterium]